MQQNEYSKDNLVNKMADEKPGNNIHEAPPPERMSFDQLCECMNRFFNDRQYEHKQAFKKGYNCVVGEDYSNVDLLCNLNDLVYNYCSNKNMSPEQKANFKNLCTGIQMLTTSMKQYDTNDTDQVFVAHLTGYILKVIRNFYHD